MKIKNEISCESCKNCLIGKYCSPIWMSIVDSGKNQLVYQKGQYIFYEGAPVFGLHLVVEGKVKVISKVKENKDQIVRFATNGHVLGRWGSPDDIYGNSATPLERSTVCFINNDLFRDVCMNNPEFAFQLTLYYALELRKSEKQNIVLGQMEVKEKVVATLCHFVDVFGLDAKKNVNAELSRQDIADTAAITLEQVSRVITVLKKTNAISTNGKKIVINDIGKLNGIASL